MQRQDLQGVSSDILLSQAILAHNSLATLDGTVPIQRVTGVIPRLPSILTDRPSSMAPLTSEFGSHVTHLLAIQSARTAFAAAQASASLKKALASRIYPSSRATYQTDDRVFFADRETGPMKWRGPGRVIGFSPEAKTVVIQYGRQSYLRHVTKVRLSREDENVAVVEDPAVADPEHHVPDMGPSSLSDAPALTTPLRNPRAIQASADSQTTEAIDSNPILHLDSSVKQPPGDAEVTREDGQLAPDDSFQNLYPSVAIHESSEPPPSRQSARLDTTRGYQGRYGTNPGQPSHTVFLVAPQARRGQEGGPPDTVFAVSRSREIPPADQGPEFLAAKEQEIADIRSHGAIEAVPISSLDCDAQVIDTRFVCEIKVKEDGQSIPKARLVAKGFQESVEHEAVDAPTVSRAGVRLILFLAAQRNWRIRALDFKRAFLQARERHPTDRVIAVIPPPEANEPPGVVWRLVKSLYGLRSAPREWWLTLYAALISLGFTQSAHDPSIFIFHSQTTKSIIGVVAIHVDDMLATGAPEFDAILDECDIRFRIGSHKTDSFMYLGIAVTSRHTNTGFQIELCQAGYISSINEVQAQDGDELTPEHLEDLNHVVGEIMWVAASTRCDIAVEAAMLVSEMSTPTTMTIRKTNKLVRYLRATRDTPMVLSSLDPQVELEFKVFSDVLNLCSSLYSCIWIRDLFAEISGSRLQIQAFTDCKSVEENSRSLRLQVTERRLTNYMWTLREMLEQREIKPLAHVPSEDMLADGLTKRHAGRREVLRRLLFSGSHVTLPEWG